MKELYLIGGTMGVGKTTVCRALQGMLDKSVFLDGDWCWDMRPFQVTDETKRLVMDNICYMLRGFLGCGAFENVIFCWVMHRQEILDEILARLAGLPFRAHSVSLVCDREALEARIAGDVARGARTPDVLARSLARLDMYRALNTQKIDTTHQTPAQVARAILKSAPFTNA